MDTAERTITLKPWRVASYSRAMTVPAWWLRLNGFAEELEVTFTMEEIIVRPKVRQEGRGEPERASRR